MTILPISTWIENTKKKYSRQVTKQAMIEPDGDLSGLTQQLRALVGDRLYGGPRGIHFGSWRGTSNDKANLHSAHAACLSYHVSKAGEVIEAAQKLGMRCLLLTTEDKKQTTNAITLVIPYASPVTIPVHERVTSCLAHRFDIYGMIDGVLSATHIVNIHATTEIVEIGGSLFDADAYKEQTSRMYQVQDGRKFNQAERAPQSSRAAAQLNKPVFTCADSDLFSW